jgi:hypothetical protein
MVRAHAAQVEGMAREKATLLATAHDEAVGATQKVSVLVDQLATVHQDKDAAEEKISCFSSVVVMSWARGCTSLPFPGVEALGASARG